MIPRGTFSVEQWNELAQEAALASRGLLGRAITVELASRQSTYRAILEDPIRSVPALRAAQGAIEANNRATMILDDILRQARANGRVVADNNGDTDA